MRRPQLRRRQIITICLRQLHGQCSSTRLPPSPLVYYFVCFAPFTKEDSGQGAYSHDRWLMLCVWCLCVCMGVLFCVRRRNSQTRSILRHCLISTFSPTGHMVKGEIWLVWEQKPHSHAPDRRHEIWRKSIISATLASYTVLNSTGVSTDLRWQQPLWNTAGATAWFLPIKFNGKKWKLSAYGLNVMTDTECACQFCPWQKPGQDRPNLSPG